MTRTLMIKTTAAAAAAAATTTTTTTAAAATTTTTAPLPRVFWLPHLHWFALEGARSVFLEVHWLYCAVCDSIFDSDDDDDDPL